jgi:kumamolisin
MHLTRGGDSLPAAASSGRSRAVILLLCATLASISLAGAAPEVVGSPGHQPAASGDLYHALLAASQDLGPTAADRRVELMLNLADGSSSRVDAEIAAMYTPGSAAFGRRVSAAEYDAAHGARPEDAARAADYLNAAGLHATWRQGQRWISVDGPAATVESVFGVGIRDFRALSGGAFYASTGPVRVPPALVGVVTDTSWVTDYQPAHLHSVPPGGLKPVDVATAYNTKPLRDQGIDGTGATVVLWALGDSFKQADIDAFDQKYGLPPLTPEVNGPSAASLKSEGEIIMDIEVVHAIAPGAKILVDTTQPPKAVAGMLDVQAKLVDEAQGGIVSQSWGGCEKLDPPAYVEGTKSVYDKAAELGVQVFVSTGDSGGYECLTADFGRPPRDELIGVPLPAAAPGVTAVGGTRLSVRQDGGYYHESVWENPAVMEGGGGGLSNFYSMPPWQKGPGVQNEFSNGMRQIPDVSADADPTSGMSILSDGKPDQGGGTSQSSPMWAGFAALINQYLRKQGVKPVGFLNPALYAVAEKKKPLPAFHDVTTGTNLVYPAAAGYSLATGLGTPDVYNLALDLELYQRSQ